MTIPHSFSLFAFGCTLQAETESAEIYSLLNQYVFPSIPRATAAERPDVRLRVLARADGYEIQIDDTTIASAGDTTSLLLEVTRALDDALIPRFKGLRAIHAGAVVWKGRALLLPGITHAGKSSLVAELVRRGAAYFSDEYALIDADGRVHPYPRPLLLRRGTPQQFPVLASDLKAETGSASAPVGWIFFLAYAPECVWSPAAVSQSEGVLALLKNSPHVLAESPDMLPAFQYAVAKALCYTGCRPDVAVAADCILRAVD